MLQGKVFENLPPGAKVLKLNASDMDEGLEDRRISYRIIGGDGLGYFGVDDEGKRFFLYYSLTLSTPGSWNKYFLCMNCHKKYSTCQHAYSMDYKLHAGNCHFQV